MMDFSLLVLLIDIIIVIVFYPMTLVNLILLCQLTISTSSVSLRDDHVFMQAFLVCPATGEEFH